MHTRFVNMGPIDLDHIKIILLLNAFGNCWEHIQSSLWSSLDSPSFGINSILRRLDQEDSRARSHATQSGDTATALAAIRKDKLPRICSNCQKEGHITNFCIKPGGSMAGKMLNEARTVQCNARRSRCNGNNSSQQSTSATANVAATGATPVERTVTIDGQTFTLTPSVPSPPIAASVNTAVALSDTVFPGNLSDYDTDTSSFMPSINFALTGAMPTPHSLPAQDEFKFKAYMALNGCHRRTESCPGGGLGPTSCGRKCTGEGGIVGRHLGRWINCLHLGPLRLMPPRLFELPSPNPLALFQRVIVCVYLLLVSIQTCHSLVSGRRQKALGLRHSSRLATSLYYLGPFSCTPLLYDVMASS